MGKVGIVCCHNTANYGSRLQIYALQRVLNETLSVQSEIIDYDPTMDYRAFTKKIMMLPLNVFSARWWKGKVKPKMNTLGSNNNTYQQQRVNVLNQYKRENYIMGDKIFTYKELKRSAQKYDVILCGSDQIWHPDCIYNSYYMMEFTRNVKKSVAYGSSIGVQKIERKYIFWYRYYLKHLDAITMRERQGAELLSQILKRNIPVVLDPVALLDRGGWEDVANASQSNVKRLSDSAYVFCYFLGDNVRHREFAEKHAEKNGLKIISMPHLKIENIGDERLPSIKLSGITPEDLVFLIKNATFIMTDSFHVSMFSIIFEKQFIAFERFSGGIMSANSRLYNLFEFLKIENRIFSGEEDPKDIPLIEYEMVSEKLNAERINSLRRLSSMLDSQFDE